MQKGPVSGTRSQALGSGVSQVSVASGTDSSPGRPDTVANVLSIVAFLVAGAALYFTYGVYQAAQLKGWAN
jgi:hypothetical protein